MRNVSCEYVSIKMQCVKCKFSVPGNKVGQQTFPDFVYFVEFLCDHFSQITV